MLAQTKTVHGLSPFAVTLLAYGLLTLSVLIEVSLYASFGFSPFQKLAYSAIGFFIAVLGAVSAATMGYFFKRANYLVAFCGLLLWLAQFIAAVLGHAGFMAYSIQERNLNTDLAKVVKSQTIANTGNNTGFINQQLAELNQQILVLNTEIKNCPANFFRACINPKKEKIGFLELQKAKLEKGAVLSEHVQDDLIHLSDIQSGQGELGEKNTLPLFIMLSSLFDGSIKPSALQSYFLVFIAVLIELSTSFTFYLKYALSEDSELGSVYVEGMRVNHHQQSVGLSSSLSCLDNKPSLENKDFAARQVKRVNDNLAVCGFCQSEYKKSVSWQKFCCSSCRDSYKAKLNTA